MRKPGLAGEKDHNQGLISTLTVQGNTSRFAFRQKCGIESWGHEVEIPNDPRKDWEHHQTGRVLVNNWCLWYSVEFNQCPNGGDCQKLVYLMIIKPDESFRVVCWYTDNAQRLIFEDWTNEYLKIEDYEIPPPLEIVESLRGLKDCRRLLSWRQMHEEREAKTT